MNRLTPTDAPARQVCERLRVELQRRDFSQADMATAIGWTQSKVSKVLNGETVLTYNDFVALCVAVGLRPTEAVRDPALEFCAELTPSELRLLEEIRRRPGLLDALERLLRALR